VAKLVVELWVVLLVMLLVMLSAKLLAALLAVSVGVGLPVVQADLIFGVQNKWGKLAHTIYQQSFALDENPIPSARECGCYGTVSAAPCSREGGGEGKGCWVPDRPQTVEVERGTADTLVAGCW